MNPTNEHREQARELESIFVVIGEIGGVWATFDTREKAERYPGPRMLELAARQIIEYVPASALSSRDVEIREVLGDLRGHCGPSNCWCDAEGDAPHLYCCTAAATLYAKLQPGKKGNE